METQIDRQKAVLGAAKAWQGAPGHVKAMAGAYVGPLLDAIILMGRELDEIRGQIAGEAKGGQHGA